MSAVAVATAIARDAGIARRALLGVSPAIRNPENPLFRRKLGTRAAGVNARRIRVRGAAAETEACRLRRERGGITGWNFRRTSDARYRAPPPGAVRAQRCSALHRDGRDGGGCAYRGGRRARHSYG